MKKYKSPLFKYLFYLALVGTSIKALAADVEVGSEILVPENAAQVAQAWVYPGLGNQGELVLIDVPQWKGESLSGESFDLRVEGFEKASVEFKIDPSSGRIQVNPKKDPAQASIVGAFILANQANVYFTQRLGFGEIAHARAVTISVNQKLESGADIEECSPEANYGEMNFPGESKKCRNAIEPKAFFHEYTHQVDSLIGGESDNDLAEGLADMAAVYFTQSPAIEVLPLKGAHKFKRSCDNSIKFNYKQKTSPDPKVYYRQGLAWCGFAWDARQALIKKYGEQQGLLIAEELFFSPLKYNAKTIPDAVERVFYQHTPDGVFSHGKDFQLLKAAAQKHGFQVGETAENI